MRCRSATSRLQPVRRVTAAEDGVRRWIAGHAHQTNQAGRCRVVRNRRPPPRSIVKGLGPIGIPRGFARHKRAR